MREGTPTIEGVSPPCGLKGHRERGKGHLIARTGAEWRMSDNIENPDSWMAVPSQIDCLGYNISVTPFT